MPLQLLNTAPRFLGRNGLIQGRRFKGLHGVALHHDRVSRRPPGVSSCPFGAQPLDLRCRALMDLDFGISRSLVRP